MGRMGYAIRKCLSAVFQQPRARKTYLHDEFYKNCRKSAEMRPQRMGNAPTNALNAIRTVETIRAELARLDAELARLEKDYWLAAAAVTKRGLQVRVPLIDKDRKVTRKLRPNPALRLQREARAAMAGIREDKERLLAEIADIEKAAKAAEQKDKFAFLDNT
jgi:hypothetical protein